MAEPLSKESKFYILMGVYAGAWGIVPGLTPKLIPLDLDWMGLGILAFSFGAFMHAITFPCTDVVAEIWGAKRARFMVYVGFGVYAVAIAFYMLGTALPAAPVWPHNDAYVAVFSQASRLIVGSISAIIIAQLLDIFIFEKIKQMTGEGNLWIRNNASTAVSQLADTTIFYSIAFYGVIPTDVLPALIIGTYFVKLIITAVDTPVVYLLVYWITGKWSAKGDMVEQKS